MALVKAAIVITIITALLGFFADFGEGTWLKGKVKDPVRRTRPKSEAVAEFIKKIKERSFSTYLKNNWLTPWNDEKKKFKETKIEGRTLIFWNEAHNYVAPKAKQASSLPIGRQQDYSRRRRRRRRGGCTKRKERKGLCTRGKRDEFQEDVVLRRAKRQTCTFVPSPPALTRMEWRQMSAADRTSFITAFNQMATTLVPGLSITEHQLFVQQHRQSNSPACHNGAAFSAWHREWLWRFSNVMREHGLTGGIPYYDNVVDADLPNPADSAVWTDAEFGLNTGLVNQPWPDITAITECELSGSNILRRNMKTHTSAQAHMMDIAFLNSILNKACFQHLTKGWDVEFEEAHESMLLLMGTPTTAQMADANCAPTDPFYWLHTTFMDLIWERYRIDNQNFAERELHYPLTQLAGTGFSNPNRHKWKAQMHPFLGLFNGHGMSNHYTSYYYHYSQPPSSVSCNSHTDCTGQDGSMLWCRNGACTGMIKEGGQCNPSWPDVQCHCPTGTPDCDANTLLCGC